MLTLYDIYQGTDTQKMREMYLHYTHNIRA